MALKDILERIGADAKAEADTILAEAKAQADARLADARDRASRDREQTVARAKADAERDAATVVANARLHARDAALTARQAMVAEVLSAVEGALVALPDDRYAALVADDVRTSALGGETLRVGSADAARLRGPLEKAMQTAGVAVTISGEPADIERGAVLLGDRTRVEVSPAAMVEARHEDLLIQADRLLFGDGKA